MGGQSRRKGVKARPCMTDEKTDTGGIGNWPEVTHLEWSVCDLKPGHLA